MARQLRWQIQFMSLNGTACHVDIYKESVETLQVIQLTGGANPFYYDEDNDKNLLQRIRYRTGYIQVIEHSYHELEELIPDSNTSRYVEFYYGTRLDFVGYIQTQEQNSNWGDYPRVWKLPIMSPLGLLEGTTFEEGQFTSAAILNVNNPLSYVIYAMCQATGATYDRIYYPNSNSMRLNAYVNWNLFAPRNPDYWEGTLPVTMSNPRYEYMTWAEILEGICNIYDWVCHDLPGGLMFTKFDHDNTYMSMMTYQGSFRNEGTVSFAGNTEYAFYDLFSLADNKGKETLVQPVKRVTETFECEQNEAAKLDISCCHYLTSTLHSIGGEYKYIYIYEDLSAQQATIPDTWCFVNSGYTPYWQDTWCAQIASIGDDDGKIVVLRKNENYWPSGSTKVFSFYLPYNVPVQKNYTIEADIEVAEGGSWDMEKPEYQIRMKASVIFATSVLTQDATPATVYINNGVAQIVATDSIPQMRLGFVRIDIYSDGWQRMQNNQWADVPRNFMMSIKNLRMRTYTSFGGDRFDAAQANVKVHLPGSDVGKEIEIANLFRADMFNDNRLMLTNSAPEVSNEYRYLGISRRQIEVACKQESSFNALSLYAGKISLNSKNYRLLSLSFTPRDDEYNVTIHELREEEV